MSKKNQVHEAEPAQEKDEKHPGLEGELQGGDPSELEATERGLPEEENPNDLDSGAEQPPDGLDPARFDLAHPTKPKRHTAGGAGGRDALAVRSAVARNLSQLKTTEITQDNVLCALARVSLGHRCLPDMTLLQNFLDQQEEE